MADGSVADGGDVADENETLEVLEVPLGDAFRMARDGRVRDLKTAFLLERAALERGRAALARPDRHAAVERRGERSAS